MKVSNLVAVVALIAAAALGFLWVGARDQAAKAQAEADALRKARGELEARVSELEAEKIDSTTLERLRAAEREAIKLRGDVGVLKKQLATAQAAAAANNRSVATKAEIAAPAPAQEPATTMTTNANARTLNYKGVANLLPGQAMALGGWETRPGFKGFALVSPQASDPNNPQSITVEAKWIEVSNDAASAINLENLLPSTGQQSTIEAGQYDGLLKQMQQTAGVNIMSSPKVTTLSGRQAEISVTEQRATAGGPMEFGPRVNLVPTQRQDGTVDLAYEGSITMPNEQNAQAQAK